MLKSVLLEYKKSRNDFRLQIQKCESRTEFSFCQGKLLVAQNMQHEYVYKQKEFTIKNCVYLETNNCNWNQKTLSKLIIT